MSFVQQRERRANAGSRMRALLDNELDMGVLFDLEESEDESFSEMEQDEIQDIVDSDFDTEESEEEEDQEQLAKEEEKRIRKEERQTKKPNVKQQKSSKASTSTLPKVLNNNNITKPTTHRTKRNDIQHISDFGSSSRQSLRTKTVLNRIQIEEQIRENEQRRALIPKRFRPEVKRLTQEELLAEAAKTEEENRASLLQWQQKEAERQAKSKIQVKKTIEGPFIRYHSFTDGTDYDRPKQRKVIMLVDNDDNNDGDKNNSIPDNGHDHKIKVKQVEIMDPAVLEHQYQIDVLKSNMESRNLITFFSSSDSTNNNNNNNNNNENQPIKTNSDDHNNNNNSTISRNKLAHINTNGLTDREIDKLDLIPALSSWTEKSHRANKPIICPITGKEARYRDPITTTPYATKTAYHIIKDCLQHKYIWSSSLGIYVGHENHAEGASGVLDGWDRMMKGKKEGSNNWEPPYPSWFNESTEISSSTSSASASPSSMEVVNDHNPSPSTTTTTYENNDTKSSKKRQRRAIT